MRFIWKREQAEILKLSSKAHSADSHMTLISSNNLSLSSSIFEFTSMNRCIVSTDRRSTADYSRTIKSVQLPTERVNLTLIAVEGSKKHSSASESDRWN